MFDPAVHAIAKKLPIPLSLEGTKGMVYHAASSVGAAVLESASEKLFGPQKEKTGYDLPDQSVLSSGGIKDHQVFEDYFHKPEQEGHIDLKAHYQHRPADSFNQATTTIDRCVGNVAKQTLGVEVVGSTTQALGEMGKEMLLSLPMGETLRKTAERGLDSWSKKTVDAERSFDQRNNQIIASSRINPADCDWPEEKAMKEKQD